MTVNIYLITLHVNLQLNILSFINILRRLLINYYTLLIQTFFMKTKNRQSSNYFIVNEQTYKVMKKALDEYMKELNNIEGD